MRLRTVTLLSFLLIALAAFPALAQTETAAPAGTAAVPAEQAAAPATVAEARTEADSEVAGQLQELLRVHPPEVGTILELDPMLITDAAFVGRHPELAAFMARHPEVGANPRLYLNSIHVGGVDATTTGERMVERFLEGIMIFSVMLLFILTGVWLIRTIVQERRWSRLTRTQNEVHSKLLDRFTASEDLIAYVQSPAGRRFLESTPIPVEPESAAPMSAPISRMFWSIQVGIVVAAGAIGLLLASGRFEKEAGSSLFALGTVALCVGAGFAIAGVVSWVLSRRMGLLPRPGDAARGAD
jgi:hypothetical protein